MTKEEKKTKKNIKKKVTQLIPQNDAKYTLQSFDDLVLKIHKDINEICDYDKVRKILCTYAQIDENKIKFCAEKTDLSYKKLQKQLNENKTIEQTNESLKKVKSSFLFSNNDESSEDEIDEDTYIYPKENTTLYSKTIFEVNGPFGTQWIHDEQIDDELNDEINRRAKQLSYFMTLTFHEQKSEGWLLERKKYITMSDAGTVLNLNSHDEPFNIVIKKVISIPFEPNRFCYHGTKFEHIATMVYSYRMNVTVEEFGLIPHPTIDFLAASPDGIIGHYKLDGKSKTKYVGRMVEIKCPLMRKIKTSGEIYGEICPEYYWAQVQGQLECCDLDECDFWQCDIREYDDRDEFNRDTDINEPFRSKQTGMEKGCLIQLLPKSEDVTGDKYHPVVWEKAKHLYPPRIEMSPLDCDLWIAETISKGLPEKYKDYYVDRIVYWKMIKTHCVLIKRDKEWFKTQFPIFRKTWNYILYMRKNPEKAQLIIDYYNFVCCKKFARKDDKYKKITALVEYLMNEPDEKDDHKIKQYSKKILDTTAEIDKIKKERQIAEEEEDDN